MKLKIIIPFLIVALAMWIFWIKVALDTRAINITKIPPGWTFTLPQGDAQVGQATFLEKQCYTCHTINISGFAAPGVHGGIGPDLTRRYAKLPAEYLAESIIMAHKQVADRDYQMKKELAGMGNYNDFLTVTELTNLVAFLKERPYTVAKIDK